MKKAVTSQSKKSTSTLPPTPAARVLGRSMGSPASAFDDIWADDGAAACYAAEESDELSALADFERVHGSLDSYLDM